MKRNKHLFTGLLLTFAMLSPLTALAKVRVADPVRVVIPAIAVNAKIEARGTTGGGFMLPPKSAWNVAWHLHSVRPGNVGNAVMYGHINTRSSSSGVFSKLYRVRPGNTVLVTDAKKVTRIFRVKKVGLYKRTELPLREVSGKTKKIRLNLYTCAGSWNQRLADYSQRFIVFAEFESVMKVARKQTTPHLAAEVSSDQTN